MIAIVIPGEPVAQGRPRAGKSWAGKTTLRDPEKSRNYKRFVHAVAVQQKVGEPLEGALFVRIRVYRSIPKAMQTAPKMQRILEGTLRPTTKPDVDNYAKGVKDALNGVIWQDDSQVVDLFVSKYFSKEPRVEVEVYQLGLEEIPYTL